MNGDQISVGANGTYVSAPSVMSGAVSPMARDKAEDQTREDPRKGRWQYLMPDRLPLGRAQCVRPLA